MKRLTKLVAWMLVSALTWGPFAYGAVGGASATEQNFANNSGIIMTGQTITTSQGFAIQYVDYVHNSVTIVSGGKPVQDQLLNAGTGGAVTILKTYHYSGSFLDWSVDTYGNKTVYNAEGMPTTTTNPEGGVVSENKYDSKGSILETDYYGVVSPLLADGTVDTNPADASKPMIIKKITYKNGLQDAEYALADPNNAASGLVQVGTFNYGKDSSGNTTRNLATETMTSKDGTTSLVHFSVGGRYDYITNDKGAKTTQYEYDKAGRQIGITSYDPSGAKLTQTDFDIWGRETNAWSYSQNGNLDRNATVTVGGQSFSSNLISHMDYNTGAPTQDTAGNVVPTGGVMQKTEYQWNIDKNLSTVLGVQLNYAFYFHGDPSRQSNTGMKTFGVVQDNSTDITGTGVSGQGGGNINTGANGGNDVAANPAVDSALTNFQNDLSAAMDGDIDPATSDRINKDVGAITGSGTPAEKDAAFADLQSMIPATNAADGSALDPTQLNNDLRSLGLAMGAAQASIDSSRAAAAANQQANIANQTAPANADVVSSITNFQNHLSAAMDGDIDPATSDRLNKDVATLTGSASSADKSAALVDMQSMIPATNAADGSALDPTQLNNDIQSIGLGMGAQQASIDSSRASAAANQQANDQTPPPPTKETPKTPPPPQAPITAPTSGTNNKAILRATPRLGVDNISADAAPTSANPTLANILSVLNTTANDLENKGAISGADTLRAQIDTLATANSSNFKAVVNQIVYNISNIPSSLSGSYLNSATQAEQATIMDERTALISALSNGSLETGWGAQ